MCRADFVLDCLRKLGKTAKSVAAYTKALELDKNHFEGDFSAFSLSHRVAALAGRAAANYERKEFDKALLVCFSAVISKR